MPKRACHLTYEQRCQIVAFLQAGICRAQIARQLGVHRSTITRELQRNRGKCGYRFKQAHNKASDRRKKASSVRRKITPSQIEKME
ncbi:MAG: helix-turn-helix domain-containing protein [Hyphomicrobiaceae bacterium]|nr:helix-turn-helix domain-containing protein [Hyphomicrobiaceae bacterium]